MSMIQELRILSRVDLYQDIMHMPQSPKNNLQITVPPAPVVAEVDLIGVCVTETETDAVWRTPRGETMM